MAEKYFRYNIPIFKTLLKQQLSLSLSLLLSKLVMHQMCSRQSFQGEVVYFNRVTGKFGRNRQASEQSKPCSGWKRSLYRLEKGFVVLKTCVFIHTAQADRIKDACPVKSVSHPPLYRGCNSTGVNALFFQLKFPFSGTLLF